MKESVTANNYLIVALEWQEGFLVVRDLHFYKNENNFGFCPYNIRSFRMKQRGPARMKFTKSDFFTGSATFDVQQLLVHPAGHSSQVSSARIGNGTLPRY
jgi:hypothetical protein